MPIRKTRLSAAELEENRCYLRQLYAEGIDVEIPEARQVSSRRSAPALLRVGGLADAARSSDFDRVSEVGLEFPALQVIRLRAIACAGFIRADLFATSSHRRRRRRLLPADRVREHEVIRIDALSHASGERDRLGVDLRRDLASARAGLLRRHRGCQCEHDAGETGDISQIHDGSVYGRAYTRRCSIQHSVPN